MKDYFSLTPAEQHDYAARLAAFRPSNPWTSADIDTALALLPPVRTSWSDLPRLKATRNPKLIAPYISTARTMVANFKPAPLAVRGGSASVPNASASAPVRGDSAPVPGASASGLVPHGAPSPFTGEGRGEGLGAEGLRGEGLRGEGLGGGRDMSALPPGLAHEYANIKTLYYAPLGRYHQQASKLVEEAIDLAVKYGFLGGEYEGMPQATIQGKVIKNPLYPDQTRQYLAEQICHCDDRLATLWRLIDFFQDNGGYQAILASVPGGLAVGHAPVPDASASGPVLSKLLSKAKQLKIPVFTIGADTPESGTSYNKRSLSELLLLPDSDEKTELIRARIERDKKLLRRTDRKPTEAHKQTVEQAVQELHSQGILITEKQVSVCQHYGVAVAPAWREPTAEERAAALAELHNTEEWKNKVKAQKLKSFYKNHPEAAMRKELRAEAKRERQTVFGE